MPPCLVYFNLCTKAMGNFLNFNGKVYRSDKVFIGANNRSLRYGDGLFETMKIQGGKIVLADDHFDRLWKGLQLLEFDVPLTFSRETLTKHILALPGKNMHPRDVRVRLNVFRGDGGLNDVINNFPNYIIQTWVLPDHSNQLNSNGIVAGIYEDARKTCDAFSNLKHNNFLPYVMAAFHAKKMKWNDAIVLNSYGRICESTIANIFYIKDNVVYTPALTEGCIAGVMRKSLLAKLPAIGYEVVKKEVTIDELLNADEVFFTNAVSPIRWLQSIDNKTLGNTITQKIHAGLSW
jgi:branched-chain amino acid aminotransferase